MKKCPTCGQHVRDNLNDEIDALVLSGGIKTFKVEPEDVQRLRSRIAYSVKINGGEYKTVFNGDTLVVAVLR